MQPDASSRSAVYSFLREARSNRQSRRLRSATPFRTNYTFVCPPSAFANWSCFPRRIPRAPLRQARFAKRRALRVWKLWAGNPSEAWKQSALVRRWSSRPARSATTVHSWRRGNFGIRPSLASISLVSGKIRDSAARTLRLPTSPSANLTRSYLKSQVAPRFWTCGNRQRSLRHMPLRPIDRAESFHGRLHVANPARGRSRQPLSSAVLVRARQFPYPRIVPFLTPV